MAFHKKKTWANGWVYFNHLFRPPRASTYPPEMIKEAYRRGAALFFPQSFPGADIEFDGEDTCTLLLVQVKNEEEGCIGNGTRDTAWKALKDASKKIADLGSYLFLFMSPCPKKYKRKQPDIRKNLAAEGSLIVIVVGIHASLYPSVGIQSHKDKQTKSRQEMIFEHLAHIRDALPMPRFSNTMEESQQAEDLLGHLVV